MQLLKEAQYKQCIKKFKKDHKKTQLELVDKIEQVLMNYDNLQELKNSPFWNMYRFEKLTNKDGRFSVRLENGYRLEFKPNNSKKYEYIEVVCITLHEVSKHYKK